MLALSPIEFRKNITHTSFVPSSYLVRLNDPSIEAKEIRIWYEAEEKLPQNGIASEAGAGNFISTSVVLCNKKSKFVRTLKSY